MNYINDYLNDTIRVLETIDKNKIKKMIDHLSNLRERKGRLFIIGVGGSAGNALHASCDFRKLAQIETYTPVDNVAELTAQTNDCGWEFTFVNWLMGCNFNERDALLVLSVGGGNKELNVSPNICNALEYAKKNMATILGIVGTDGGHTVKLADTCLIVPTVSQDKITPLTESVQVLVTHLLVTHPDLKKRPMKWEEIINQC